MMLDWIKIGAGALVGGCVVMVWAVLVYGPSQYDAGGMAKAAELDAATNHAAKEIADEADRAAFLRRQCIERGGVYDFADGRCLEG